MENAPLNGTITPGFKAWMLEPARALSAQLGFGAWWRSGAGAYWRVSWIEATHELFAVEMSTADRYVFLGSFEKKDINGIMRHWSDGNNLVLLIKMFVDKAVSAMPVPPAVAILPPLLIETA